MTSEQTSYLKWFRCWVMAKEDFMRKMMWYYNRKSNDSGARKSYYCWRAGAVENRSVAKLKKV